MSTVPYKSDKQRRYMHAKHPRIAERWDKENEMAGYNPRDMAEKAVAAKKKAGKKDDRKGKAPGKPVGKPAGRTEPQRGSGRPATVKSARVAGKKPTGGRKAAPPKRGFKKK